MIILRDIQERDLDALERFAQIPGFINLPNDRELLGERVMQSVASFRGEATHKSDAKYVFVAEDLETKRIVGTSMIAAQHGTEESPHFYFEVGSERKFSETINTGFIHGTLELGHDTDGPSEIGGLVVDPEFRSSPTHIGRQVSFVRFLFMAMNRDKFKRQIIAELLPPLNKRGQSPLWEAVGRRFTNMDYWEADRLCQKNKEFIFSLFPTGKIYTTFLSAEARNAIGKVGKETEPVLHMLTKIGFKYKNHVDPFDGGPHLWADVDDIVPIKRMRIYTLESKWENAGASPESGLLSKADNEQGKAAGHFRALSLRVIAEGTKLAILDNADQARAVLGFSPGDRVAFMPYYEQKSQ